MSIHPIALIERLELLVCMTSNAMWFGMLLLIRAQEGEPVWPSGVGWLGAEAVLTGGGVRDIRGGERWQGGPSFFTLHIKQLFGSTTNDEQPERSS